MKWYISRKREYPRGPKFTLKEFAKFTWHALPALGTPIILLGGIYSGVVTTTESGVLAGAGIMSEVTLNEISGPYPDIRFIVTGALNSDNFLPTLESPKTLAAGGDWMFQDGNALADRNYEQVARNMRDSVLKVQNMRNGK